MASACAPYRLVGFAAELDWRPLPFVKPIPRLRICTACGLVRTKTALFPCGHVLCESCYDQCAQDGERVCPLDGLLCPEEDVEQREWPAEELLKRQVKCWNERNGCTSVMPASEIFQHFQRDCRHQTAPCPKCSASVLCNEVCAHLRSNCETLRTPASQDDRQTLIRDQALSLITSRRTLEEQAGEIKVLLKQLLIDRTAQGDRLNEILHGLNAYTETLKSELSQATWLIVTSDEERKRLTINSLSSMVTALGGTLRGDLVDVRKQNDDQHSRLAAAIESAKADAEENSEKTVDIIKVMFSYIRLQVKCCAFFVKGVASLEENVEKQGWACYESERVCLRGYCLSPGIYLIKGNESVTLHLWTKLHKGDVDHIVQWPLEHRMKLSVVHPEGGAESQIEVKPWRSSQNLQMPLGLYRLNPVHYYDSPSLNLSDLTRGGYVYRDQLRVKFELLR